MSPLLLGLAASLLFSVTFVLNRSIDLGGGFWVWSGVLRFAFMAPLIALLVPANGGWRPVWAEIRRAPGAWWLWSNVGFGLFYAPVCWAASLGEGWMVAGLWQLTIVAGVLLFPARPFLWRTLAASGVILAGVALMQTGHALRGTVLSALAAAGLVLVGALAYPLGNRRIMDLAGGRLSTVQRVAAMTLLSLPFWAVLGLLALAGGHPPTPPQAVQALVVAVFSGVAATLLFFRATDLARTDPVRLAAVEATQAGEVVFTVAAEAWLLGTGWPDGLSSAGLVLITAGMVAHALGSRRTRPVDQSSPLG